MQKDKKLQVKLAAFKRKDMTMRELKRKANDLESLEQELHRSNRR